MKQKKAAFSIAFLTPAFLIYTIFIILPVGLSVFYSLTDWNGITDKVFVGLKNYIKLAGNSDYLTSTRNTFTVVIYSICLQIPLGLLLAFILNNVTKGYKIFRSTFFLPVVISPIAIGLMFVLFYNSETGLINESLRSLGLEYLIRNWLSDPNYTLKSVMMPQIWQFVGLYVILFLAALQGIPESILESARIEGANALTLFLKIILPLLSDMIKISIIFCVTGSLKSFDYAWIMTKGGPGVTSSYLGVMVYKKAFVQSNMGLASAVAISIIIYALSFTSIFNKLFPEKDLTY